MGRLFTALREGWGPGVGLEGSNDGEQNISFDNEDPNSDPSVPNSEPTDVVNPSIIAQPVPTDPPETVVTLGNPIIITPAVVAVNPVVPTTTTV